MPFPNQPTLPAEEPLGEVEQLFIEESPAGLWPENQDSNFGQIRRVITQPLDDAVVLVEELFNERFVDTMSGYLGRWEKELGIPRQTTKTDQQRRSIIGSRLKKGAFTRVNRDKLIEDFIQATFGTSIALTPDGVSLPAGGVPLFADTAPVSTLYRVYERPADMSYALWIVNTVTPDLIGLTRELVHYTPGGINFSIDNTKSNILDYQRDVLNDGPSFYWPLGTTTGTGNPYQSICGIANVLAVNSAPVLQGALINNGGGVVNDVSCRDFDGVDDFLTATHDAAMSESRLTVEAWVRVDGGAGTVRTIMKKGTNTFKLELDTFGQLGFTVWAGGVGATAISLPALSTATIYHVVGTYDGAFVRLYLDGVLRSSAPLTGARDTNSSSLTIGSATTGAGSDFWNGAIDEPALYGHALPIERVLRHNNTGRNIL